MSHPESQVIWAPPVPPDSGRHPGLHPRVERDAGMIIEYDVVVPMRDGTTIYADVFRPDQPGAYPPLIAWGPYGKHGYISYDAMGNTGSGTR